MPLEETMGRAVERGIWSEGAKSITRTLGQETEKKEKLDLFKAKMMAKLGPAYAKIQQQVMRDAMMRGVNEIKLKGDEAQKKLDLLDAKIEALNAKTLNEQQKLKLAAAIEKRRKLGSETDTVQNAAAGFMDELMATGKGRISGQVIKAFNAQGSYPAWGKRMEELDKTLDELMGVEGDTGVDLFGAPESLYEKWKANTDPNKKPWIKENVEEWLKGIK